MRSLELSIKKTVNEYLEQALCCSQRITLSYLNLKVTINASCSMKRRTKSQRVRQRMLDVLKLSQSSPFSSTYRSPLSNPPVFTSTYVFNCSCHINLFFSMYWKAFFFTSLFYLHFLFFSWDAATSLSVSTPFL